MNTRHQPKKPNIIVIYFFTIITMNTRHQPKKSIMIIIIYFFTIITMNTRHPPAWRFLKNKAI